VTHIRDLLRVVESHAVPPGVVLLVNPADMERLPRYARGLPTFPDGLELGADSFRVSSFVPLGARLVDVGRAAQWSTLGMTLLNEALSEALVDEWAAVWHRPDHVGTAWWDR
jgi:hypothetical protein